jgi:hypothetical protein
MRTEKKKDEHTTYRERYREHPISCSGKRIDVFEAARVLWY